MFQVNKIRGLVGFSALPRLVWGFVSSNLKEYVIVFPKKV